MADKEDRQTTEEWESKLMKAFSHPLRRRIYRSVRERLDGGLSPREMATELDWPLSNVSYHVRVLAEAEAIVCVRLEPVRGSMQHFYAVGPKVDAVPWVKQALAE